MKLCRVIGNVVASRKVPCYTGHKLLIVQPVDEDGRGEGSSFLSMDTQGAGPGDIVLVQQEGNTARQLLGSKDDPFHSVIVGIVDKVASVGAAVDVKHYDVKPSEKKQKLAPGSPAKRRRK